MGALFDECLGGLFTSTLLATVENKNLTSWVGERSFGAHVIRVIACQWCADGLPTHIRAKWISMHAQTHLPALLSLDVVARRPTLRARGPEMRRKRHRWTCATSCHVDVAAPLVHFNFSRPRGRFVLLMSATVVGWSGFWLSISHSH